MNPENTTLIIVAIVSGLAGSIPGLLKIRADQRSQAANASAINVKTAISLMRELEAKVDEMQVRIITLERRERRYTQYLRQLIEQIEEMNVTPIVSLDQINNIALEVQQPNPHSGD